MGGIGSAFKDFAVGAGGGLGFLLIYQLFGGLGILAAPLIIGAMIKGDRGKTIATIAGFSLFALGALGMGGGNQASGDSGVM